MMFLWNLFYPIMVKSRFNRNIIRENIYNAMAMSMLQNQFVAKEIHGLFGSLHSAYFCWWIMLLFLTDFNHRLKDIFSWIIGLSPAALEPQVTSLWDICNLLTLNTHTHIQKNNRLSLKNRDVIRLVNGLNAQMTYNKKRLGPLFLPKMIHITSTSAIRYR